MSQDEPKCPVDHTAFLSNVLPPSACPINESGCSSDDQRNASLPPTPNERIEGQTTPLSTTRQSSSIPKGIKQEDSVWIYPSEQMFFNAMKRKNWDAKEDDMSVVVPIHNAVNEQCWKKILEWEKLHKTFVGLCLYRRY
jgi:cytochrome c heme-lyase